MGLSFPSHPGEASVGEKILHGHTTLEK